MNQPDPNARLRRLADLTIRLRSDNTVEVLAGGRSLVFGPAALGLLDLFAEPLTVSEALSRADARGGAAAWVERSATLVHLWRAGILVGDDDAAGVAGDERGLFESPGVHVRMLNDRARTSAYLAAIERVVRPDDVVLDLGTGTGVLAVAAARAGARRVFAVEASSIAAQARAVIELNGVADRVSVVEGWSTNVELPEPATVLVTETIGDEPLGERILELTIDARRRLLAPGARVVPERLRILGFAGEAAGSDLNGLVFTVELAERWRSWYGIDWSPLADATAGVVIRTSVPPAKAASWKRLTEPAVLAELDLASFAEPVVDAQATAEVRRDGTPSAGVVYFEAELAPGVRLSTEPGRGSGSSWATAAWLRTDASPVRAGDRLRLAYAYGVAGRRSGLEIDAEPA